MPLEKPFNGVENKPDGWSIACARGDDQAVMQGSPLADRDGWIDTGDLVHVDGDRYVIGRESGSDHQWA
jgi:hypothetical protein